MLAERGHSAGRTFVLEYRRSGREPHDALRGLDRDSPKMRMVREILDRVEIAEGNSGGFQPLGEPGARMTRELRGDQRVDFGAVLDRLLLSLNRGSSASAAAPRISAQNRRHSRSFWMAIRISLPSAVANRP
jgi:hypothetical protein